jgi:Ca2+-binding RTX toxin-like protein
MATIAGSQFSVTAPGLPVNVVETTTGTGLPATVPGAFNLEVFVGSLANVPPITPGYQGLAVLTSGGLELDLVSGTYAVTDNGTGFDTISAYGANETISGGSSNVTLNLFGTGDVAVGGGQDTISVGGNSNVVHGVGNDSITVTGTTNTIYAGTGQDTISIQADANTVFGGAGPDTISIFGSNDVVFAGGGTISVSGFDDTVFGGSSNDTVSFEGSGHSFYAGSGATLVDLGGTNETFVDQPSVYHDTVVGFDRSAGDRIHLTTDTAADAVANAVPVNGGQDTLITLSDNSTILLKGVTSIHPNFFS